MHWYTIYFLPVKMLGTSGFFTTAINTAATATTPTAKHIPPPYHFQDGQYDSFGGTVYENIVYLGTTQGNLNMVYWAGILRTTIKQRGSN